MSQNDDIQEIKQKLDSLWDKLFEDNGDKCLQSRINDNSLWIKIIVGAFSTVGAAIIGSIVWIAAWLARGKLS